MRNSNVFALLTLQDSQHKESGQEQDGGMQMNISILSNLYDYLLSFLNFLKLLTLSCLLSEIRSSQNGVSRSPSQAQLKQTMTIMPMPSSGLVPGPTTNLNIGMDYWANTASSSPAVHGKATPTTVRGTGVSPEPWMQVFSWILC